MKIRKKKSFDNDVAFDLNYLVLLDIVAEVGVVATGEALQGLIRVSLGNVGLGRISAVGQVPGPSRLELLGISFLSTHAS